MPTAGYSEPPLAQKLGIKPGMRVVVADGPPDYATLLAPLPPGVKIVASTADPEFVHVFATSRASLAKRLRALRESIAQDGVVWVSWPKKAAKVATNITEDVIREVALPLEFVDVKVCAVDETWSGLKLVIRREARRKGR